MVLISQITSPRSDPSLQSTMGPLNGGTKKFPLGRPLCKLKINKSPCVKNHKIPHNIWEFCKKSRGVFQNFERGSTLGAACNPANNALPQTPHGSWPILSSIHTCPVIGSQDGVSGSWFCFAWPISQSWQMCCLWKCISSYLNLHQSIGTGPTP